MSLDSLIRPVVVGGTQLPRNVFLAPVAGYSDMPYRSICVDWGAAFCYTEMVSSEALVRDSKKTLSLMRKAENEINYAIQLFGSNPETMARAAELASKLSPAIIDVNGGCPVPKIVKSGAGSALMKTPELFARIVKAMQAATDIPITVKMRTGWDDASRNFLDVAKACEDAGAKAITLHARTRAMGYSGTADWDAIKTLTSAVSVPVFGSGDVFKPEDVQAMLERTGCAGVMIARGMMGNPFIFRNAERFAADMEMESITHEIIARTAATHLARFADFAGERTACVEFRKHFCAYTKGMPHGAELRKEAIHASTLERFGELFEMVASA